MGLAKISTLRFLAITLVFGCCVACGAAQETNTIDAQPTRKLLLLKNGQIIEGIVTSTSDNILLSTAGGTRLVLQKDDVETVCDSAKEAYWHKAAQTRATDLDGQKRLFHWCLSQKLPQYAQNQIDIISMMNIKATELEYLHRQLTVALDQYDVDNREAKPEMQLVNSADGRVPSRSTTVEPSFLAVDELPSIRPLPAFQEFTLPEPTDAAVASRQTPSPPALTAKQSESEFAQVGFTESVTTDRSSLTESGEASEQPAVSIEELDRLTDSLPKASVAMFKRKIEPLLTRSCSGGGCHQNSDSVMPLVHAGSGQLIPRRLSQRNLYSIIKHADPNEPLASPLLTAAITSHGGLSDPVVTPPTKQFENLATWLIMISNKPNSIHQMPEPDLATRPETVVPASPTLLEKREPVLPDEESSENSLDEQSNGNPHDPDVFNRQFRGNGG